MLPEDSGSILKVYYAQVIKTDKDEQTKANRVQFKISPYNDGWEEQHLNWAFPFFLHLGSTTSSAINKIPLVDSMIYVTKILNKWYYMADARLGDEKNLAEYFFDNIKDNLGELELISAPESEYPNVVSFIYENGMCISYDVSSDNPYFSFYHPEGSYVAIDHEGSIGTYSAKNFEFRNADNVHIKIEGTDIYIIDGNDNEIVLDENGMVSTDVNGNKVETTSTGIKTTDTSNNIIEMKGNAIEIILNSANKCKIENSSTNLKTTLNNLIDQIKNIITTGSPAVHTISETSKTALDLIKQQINLLLS